MLQTNFCHQLVCGIAFPALIMSATAEAGEAAKLLMNVGLAKSAMQFICVFYFVADGPPFQSCFLGFLTGIRRRTIKTQAAKTRCPVLATAI